MAAAGVMRLEGLGRRAWGGGVVGVRGLRHSVARLGSAPGLTLVEKIVQRHLVRDDADDGEGAPARSGQIVKIRPRHVMTHDNTAAVMAKFEQLEVKQMYSSEQPVFTLDHNVQDRSEKNLRKYQEIEAFAASHGVDFYKAGEGIGHQTMCERGYITPGSMVVASDSHSNMYGGLGCLGTPVVRTDAAGIWALGHTWWQVPPVVQVKLTGQLQPGVSGKDVIVALCGAFNQDEVLNAAVEFTGDGVATLSVDERLTIANMTTEWGALAGVFPWDEALRNWYEARLQSWQARANTLAQQAARQPASRISSSDIETWNQHPLRADEDAVYAAELELDLSSVEPCVAGPNSVKAMQTVSQLEAQHIKVHKAYLVSCVNARASDLAAAADVLRGKKIAPHVEFYVAPASREVLETAQHQRVWDDLLAAGCTPLPAGCGPCIGLGTGLLEDGEVGISATNRNFKGRMGSRNADAYLASPAVVAASALSGYICAPPGAPTAGSALVARVKHSNEAIAPAQPTGTSRFVSGFPEHISGVPVFCLDDNINTDGIYAGKYTYREDISPEEQARVVMENYDPQLAPRLAGVRSVLVAGANFGTGSSREQAATALKHAGVQAVICESVNETYKRNALNNGLLVLVQPRFIQDAKAAFATRDANHAILGEPEGPLELDFSRNAIVWNGKSYPIDPISPTAQELIVLGGLEPWIRHALAARSA